MAKKKQVELTIEEKLQNALVPKEEQPYKIPNNWCWTYVSNVMNIVMGQSPKGIDTTQNISDIPLIGGASDMGNLYPIVNKYTKKPTKLSKENDVILSIRATLGRPIFSDGVYCLGRGVAGVSSNYLSKEFIRYYYICFESVLYSNATGTTFLQVTGSVLNKMLIPLPPIKEQQRIVNRIESLFTKLDKAKELIENTLAQFEQNKMAILHKAFTGELTAKWRKENNIDLSSWKKCELKEVFKVVKDKYNPQTENQIVNYIGLENIETSKGIISKNNSSEVKSIKTKFKKDDVLYGKLRPYLNKHDVVNFDGICSTDILVFRFNDINTAKYINYYFNLPMFIQYAVENSSGINLPRVSEKTISKYKISLPTIEEQQEIVNILDKLLAKYNKIKNLEQQLEKIELLKKAILAKAFRGELGTNNPDEESAEVLLKEILAEK
ncbi:restriction endonuclease subunit S [Megamonas hypermegale]|uniref:restriction endonuclease subunit S n=1 Tax=Megamonas hypermegale TaxID=158847 RepID=UPI0019579DB5|nr:restriction endonuclease subunit S [Megamonas hypermegale]MBM6760195.1 restriction endonuclease subunit S [Megamonas hypermegale]